MQDAGTLITVHFTSSARRTGCCGSSAGAIYKCGCGPAIHRLELVIGLFDLDRAEHLIAIEMAWPLVFERSSSMICGVKTR